MYVPRHGDIVWIDFEPHAGHEQAKERPALVLSEEIYSFTIDVNNREYIITARHLLPEEVTGKDIMISFGGDMKNFQFEIVGHCELSDISVLTGESPISFQNFQNSSDRFYLGTKSAGLILGQDMMFLGFPHAVFKEDNHDKHRHCLLMPNVRQATFSGFTGNRSQIVMAGDNISGFSGAPAVFQPNKGNNDYSVAGVASGYSRELVPDPEDPNILIEINKGTMYAYTLDEAINLIHEKDFPPHWEN